MKASWKWHDDGSVTLKGIGKPRRYRPRKVAPRMVEILMERLSRLLEISTLLSTRRNSFMKGEGKCADSFEKAAEIVDGIDRSQTETRATLAEVSSFYEPKAIAAAFNGAPEALAKFCDEALQRLGK